jgi:response regulator RpfG family c-di-GMP phosphodiesterase
MLRRYQLLVVDDETAIVNSIGRLFSNEPYQISSTSNPQEAVALLEKQDFDMIISDFHMGSMTGFDLFRKANSLGRKAVKVLITGTPDTSLVSDIPNDVGVKAMVIKPWEPDRFKADIRRLLGVDKED